jgi:outer membrane immunogenic protein
VLIYATGGAAWANLKAAANFVPVGVLPGLNISTDRTFFGWTVGGGLDYGISAGWTLGAEYRYTRYEGKRNLALSPLPIALPTTTPMSLSTGLQTHEITARVSYHFGAGNRSISVLDLNRARRRIAHQSGDQRRTRPIEAALVASRPSHPN